MENSTKIRKNINVSLQSKFYSKPINNILNDWTDDNLNISIEVCNSILLSDKISKSPTLSKVMTTTDLVHKMLDLYKIEKNDTLIEEILSKLISVDMAQLNDIIVNCVSNNTISPNNSKPEKKQMVEDTQKYQVVTSDEPVVTDEVDEPTPPKKEVKKESSNNFEYTDETLDDKSSNNHEKKDEGVDYDIPMNFLLND